MTKAKTIIEALNDYIGFLFSYTKELEKKLDEIEEIVFNLDEKTPDDLYAECLAYKDINKTKQNNILGRS
tara:strand:+ start:1170 stop:1379 length:210 start_codon:yes stop_codon:yes gene_type:complete